MEEPLIYTENGNVPLSTLDYKTDWNEEVNYEVLLSFKDGIPKPSVTRTGHIVFIEQYLDKETGKVVKESRHVRIYKGMDLHNEQGVLQ